MAPTRNRRPKEKPDTAIPRYVIDLSLNPEDRYVALAKQYREQIHELTFLFDDLLSDLGVPEGFHAAINRAAGLLLRKVHSPIETAELRGISRTAGVSMYLLVALNLVLDLLMGCTSGAVRAREEGQETMDARMLHFRTLDWGMDPLRSIIVHLDYIRSKTDTATEIIGSSITYVGFVGILTGLRKDLSLSLNFRALHDAATKTQQFRFYLHHILVLLGIRQSISSLLRSTLFGHDRDWTEKPKTLEEIKQTVPSKHTTAAYLIFSDGKKSISMEKDFCTAITRESQSFIVTTNHDLEEHANPKGLSHPASRVIAMRELLEESEDRRKCVVRKWQAKLRRERRARESTINQCTRDRAHTRSMRSAKASSDNVNGQGRVEPAYPATTCSESTLDSVEQDMAVTREELVRWTTSFPTTNECTHFAAILDPNTGQVIWSERYLQPPEFPSDEAPRVELDHYLESNWAPKP